MKYIDVSEHQGTINWEKVKPNISGAILRAGYGRNNIDKFFIQNATKCNKLDIPIGAYWFSYAYTVEMAREEANYFLQLVKQFKFELPLAFDFEYDSVSNASRHGVTITSKLASNMARAFCETIENAGYYVLNYANPDYLTRYFDENINTRYGIWLAQWPTVVISTKKPPRDCQIWQYSSKGKIDGISTKVDMNESYIDFKTLITEKGLNNLKTETALDWARAQQLIDDTKPLNWETLAEVIQKIYKPT